MPLLTERCIVTLSLSCICEYKEFLYWQLSTTFISLKGESHKEGYFFYILNQLYFGLSFLLIQFASSNLSKNFSVYFKVIKC